MKIKIQIKNRFTGSVLFELETENNTMKNTVVKAVYSGADLIRANLSGADLSDANLSGANLSDADLSRANLSGADLHGADLSRADLHDANLSGADLHDADLHDADLHDANLSGADLIGANLSGADLSGADLHGADLHDADLHGADLSRADLSKTKGMVKLVGVEPGNFYWKKIGIGLKNEGYQFKVGRNVLRDGEVFASDERVLCSYPGFHFASKSWCEVNYGERPYLAKIQIPMEAQINEPWATDGKASADMIDILQVFDIDGNDVTNQFKEVQQ